MARDSVQNVDAEVSGAGSALEVLFAFLRLGCISFGGPVAHLGYFQAEFVERRRWLSAEAFAELVAISQSLPGPASSQVGYAIGVHRAGLWGGLVAWVGFTTPSAILMIAFGMGHALLRGAGWERVLHGLQLAAVAFVAQAVMAMRAKLAPDAVRMLLAVLAFALVLWTAAAWSAVGAVGLGAVVGVAVLRKPEVAVSEGPKGVSRRAGAVAAGLLILLMLLAVRTRVQEATTAAMFVEMLRTGVMVFGGGHVVLPVMQGLVVSRGWLSEASFLTGYGGAQALPGPLFTLAAYVGSVVGRSVAMGLVALVGIFLPGLLLMTVALPFWETVRRARVAQAALQGVNAAVVGLLAAAWCGTVVPSTVHSVADGVLAAVALLMLVAWKRPPYMVVGLMALLGWGWPMVMARLL